MQTQHELKRVVIKPFCKDKFELIEDYEVVLPSANCIIKAGFKSNGANIPRIFWSIYPPNSPEYLSAVFVHDYLCELATSKSDYKIADLAFKEAMQTLKIHPFKVFVFYTSVRIYHLMKEFLRMK